MAEPPHAIEKRRLLFSINHTQQGWTTVKNLE